CSDSPSTPHAHTQPSERSPTHSKKSTDDTAHISAPSAASTAPKQEPAPCPTSSTKSEKTPTPSKKTKGDAHVSSSPKWDKTDTTVAKKSSPPPSQTPASTST